MPARKLHIIALDPETGEIAWHCPGPDERGACGRVAVGELMPCIDKKLIVEETDDEPYVVPRGMTLCPVTLALTLGVDMGRSRHAAEVPAS